MTRKHTPPKWILRFLRKFIESDILEGIEGDLTEIYTENEKNKGRLLANTFILFQSIGFIRSNFMKNFMPSGLRHFWYNYLLISYRSILRNKLYFGITLIGLILAMGCSLFAFIYIADELSFDKNISRSEDVFRLYKRYVNPPEHIDMLTAETSGLMGPTMLDEFPEVVNMTRISPWWDKWDITESNTHHRLQNVYFVDSTFFEIFNIRLIVGDKSGALSEPASIILTESRAKAIFGDENPVGQTIKGLEEVEFIVTGVVEDPPRQSGFDFDALASWSTTVPGVGPLNYEFMNNWLAQGFFTFLQLSPGSSPDLLVEKLPNMMKRHFPERADEYFLRLQPFSEMYLYSDEIKHMRGFKVGSMRFVKILGFSTLIILLIAVINYVNISLSRTSQNSMEVGIRKVMGSSRSQLIQRFMMETLISTIIASVLSLLLLYIFLPDINSLVSKSIPAESLLSLKSIGILIGFGLFLSLVVGLYPAWVLSAVPTSVIMQRKSGGRSAAAFKKILLGLQMFIALSLISCTYVVVRQNNYLLNKPVGFDKEKLLVIETRRGISGKTDVFESELLSYPNIESVSVSRSSVGSGNFGTTVIPEGHSDELNIRIFGVDQEFFETLGIKTRMGRTFRKHSKADSNRVMVNQSFVSQMKWPEPLGKSLKFSPEGNSFRIIGVVEDFHYQSLAESKVEPMVLYLNTYETNTATVRLGIGDISETLDYIENTWEKLASGTPINYYFVDRWFDQKYQKEQNLLRATTLFSAISLILCALGIYGLTSLILMHKTKEISIRKVLGATTRSLISLINRQFALVIILALILSVPVSYIVMDRWLAQFAYRIDIDLTAFFISGGVILLVSTVIITLLTGKTSSENPAKNLQNE